MLTFYPNTAYIEIDDIAIRGFYDHMLEVSQGHTFFQITKDIKRFVLFTYRDIQKCKKLNPMNHRLLAGDIQSLTKTKMNFDIVMAFFEKCPIFQNLYSICNTNGWS